MKITVIIPVYNQEQLIRRAVKSIPDREDLEIIIIDDGSTDDTWTKMLMVREEFKKAKIVLLYNSKNEGVASAVNKGYDNAKGEYVILLGSDDYFITEEFEKIIPLLDGSDLIYFDLEVNNGDVWKVTPLNKTGYCGSVKFMRREFIGNTRCPLDKKAGEDYVFYLDLLKKEPTELFTNMVIKHYNYPRENSLTDLVLKGKINI